VPTLLITGPGGVVKTTVAFEVCRQLEAGGVAHAMIDTDELDRIYPAPPGDPHKTNLTLTNLAAVWVNLRAAGAPRLILTMVTVSLDE
jgi:CO dehydrogenase nickel-insertion accessory protein CooC1